MKKMFNFKSLLMGLCVICGLTLFTERVQAQGVSQVNWMSEAEAMVTLEPMLVTLGDQLQALPIGSPNYIEMEMRVNLYKLIYNRIEGGESVPAALGTAINEVPLSKPDRDPAHEAIKSQLYEEAFDTLTL